MSTNTVEGYGVQEEYGAVKYLMVRTEVDLKTAKRWLIAINLMVTVDDP